MAMQWTAHTSKGLLQNGCEQYYFVTDDCSSILLYSCYMEKSRYARQSTYLCAGFELTLGTFQLLNGQGKRI